MAIRFLFAGLMTLAAVASCSAKDFEELRASDPTLAQMASQYATLYQKSKAARSEPLLCETLTAASQLTEKLGSHYSNARDAILSTRSDTQARQLDALTAQMNEVTAKLPGVRVAQGAENVYRFVDYATLAQIAPQSSASQEFLRAAGTLWSSDNGWPAFIEQQTDVTGCVNPEALAQALRKLFEQWAATPQCLREPLIPRLEEAIGQATGSRCFCGTREATQAQSRSLLEVLKKMPIPVEDGATALPASLESPDTQFQCR